MSTSVNTRVIQVTNVAPTATRDHMKTLFGYIGRIDELKLYPSEESPIQVSSRVCYVKYDDTGSASTACHLTNTVFIDRAIIVVPVEDGKIPDEGMGMMQAAPNGTVAGVLPTSSNWPCSVVNQVIGTGNGQVIMTRDPQLTQRGLPPYPPLPATMDATKIDEIRRTVFVENLAPTAKPDQLMAFFTQVGEIKFIRMAGLATEVSRSALIEFSCQQFVPTALTYNGGMFNGRTIKVSHATSAIVKPMPKMEIPSKEIEEAMKKVKEAQSLISGAVESAVDEVDEWSDMYAQHGRINYVVTPVAQSKPIEQYRANNLSMRCKKHSRSRSKSRTRSRSPGRSSKRRSRSRSRRERSRDRGRRRSPSRSQNAEKPTRRNSRSRQRRSLSKSRRKSRSKSRKRSRSPKRRPRSRSRSRKRSKTPPRGYRTGSRPTRSPDRERRRSRRSRSRSRKRRIGTKSPSPAVQKPERNGSASPAPVARKSPAAVSPKRKPSRSPKRSKRRTRSRSPRRRRSRSDSRGRKGRKSDRKRDRSRSKDRKKKESSAERKPEIKRDYDAEEKGFCSDEEKRRVRRSDGPKVPDTSPGKPSASSSAQNSPGCPPPPSEPEPEPASDEDNLKQEDMDMDSD